MPIVAKRLDAGWIKMALGMEVGLGPGHIVLHFPKKGHSPQFSAHLYCGQTSGCIKMPQLRPHCVRWGPSSPPQKGGRAPNFRPIFTAVGSRLIYIVPVSHLKIGIQGPSNNISSLHGQNYLIITNIPIIIY